MASIKNSCIVFVIERLIEKNLNQCKDFDKWTLLLANSIFLFIMIRLTLTLSKGKLRRRNERNELVTMRLIFHV